MGGPQSAHWTSKRSYLDVDEAGPEEIDEEVESDVHLCITSSNARRCMMSLYAL